MKVSVCIGTYNQKDYIGDCIASVLLQAGDGVDVEILVGDDASNDGTSDIILAWAEKHPGVVIPHIRTKNIGAARNYQNLILEANGDFIAHLDGDDYWLPGKLRAQLSFLASHRECSAVFMNAVVIDTNGCLSGVFNDGVPDTFDANFLLRKGNFLNYSSLMYRSEHKHTLLALDPPFIDYRMHLRLAQCGVLGNISSVGVVYRLFTATSLLRNNRDSVRMMGWEAVIEALQSKRCEKRAAAGSMSILLWSAVVNGCRARRFGDVHRWVVLAANAIKKEQMWGTFAASFATTAFGAIISKVKGMAERALGLKRLGVHYQR